MDTCRLIGHDSGVVPEPEGRELPCDDDWLAWPKQYEEALSTRGQALATNQDSNEP